MTKTANRLSAKLLAALVALGFAPAAPASDSTAAIFARSGELAVADRAGSREPRIHAATSARVYLSWLEPLGESRFALRVAQRAGAAWSAPRTVASGDDWFVNWSDFPALVELADGTLAAEWLVSNGGGSYQYDVNMAFSGDAGGTWGAPVTPHTDGTPTQHGFVSLLPWHAQRVLAVWLDGRATASAGPDAEAGDMALRAAVLDKAGSIHERALLDARVCTCCQTAAARLGDGAVVAYRDRSEEEIRDIAVVRLRDGRWSAPRRVHGDGWKIAGCPVNGPAIAARGNRVAVAWFTIADKVPRVNVAFSPDGADSFAPPVRIDDGDPMGRVDLVWLNDGSILLSWLELSPRGEQIRLRRVDRDGTRHASILVALSTSGRSSGFPQLARSGRDVYLVWTHGSRPTRVRTMRFELAGES